MAEPKSKFKWLHENKFYTTTPLAGYALIAAATHRAEVAFWYFVLAILMFITIQNIAISTSHYLSKPVHTNVEMISGSAGSIGNFSLELSIPNFDLSSEFELFPYPDTYKYMCKSENNQIQLYTWSNEIYQQSRKLQDQLLSGETVGNLELEPSLEESTQIYSSKELLETMLEMYNETLSKSQYVQKDNLVRRKGKWVNVTRLVYDGWEIQYQETIEEFHTRMTQKFQYIWESMHQSTESNWKRLIEALVLLQSLTQSSQSENSNAHQVLSDENLSIEQLYYGVNTEFKSILPIDFGDVEDRSSVFFVSAQNGREVQKLRFQVTISDDIQHLNLKLFSKKFLYFLMFAQIQIDQSFTIDCIQNLLNCSDGIKLRYFLRPKCDPDDFLAGGIHGIYEKLYSVQERMLDPILNTYKRLTTLTLYTDAGMLQLEPFAKHKIVLRPTARFTSETDRCVTGSFSKCTHECIFANSIELCNCYPLFLLYMAQGSEKKICSEPCQSYDQIQPDCEKMCKETHRNPCENTLYQVERSNKENIVIRPGAIFGHGTITRSIHMFENEMVSLDLSIMRSLTHPQITEDYAMSPADFLAELGGLTDFWVGINVIAILHFIVYFTKQIFHLADNKNKNKTFPGSESTPEIRFRQALQEMNEKFEKELAELFDQSECIDV